MINTLMGSIREYKKAAIATPIIVTGEVVMEVLIPFVTAQLINTIQAGASIAQMLPYAGLLVLMALASLCFGIGAGAPAPRQAAALPRICATTSLPPCSASASPTSTSSRRARW